MTDVALQPLAAPESPAEILKSLVIVTIAGASEFTVNYRMASVSCRIMQEQGKLTSPEALVHRIIGLREEIHLVLDAACRELL